MIRITAFVLVLLLPTIGMAATINTSSSILVLNEFLADGGIADANGDSNIDVICDEFVEIVNVSSVPVNLSGFTLWDSHFATARHTFADGTVLDPYDPIVVFGGGTPTGFDGIQVQIATNSDTIPFGLHLNDSSDRIILRDALNNIVFDVSYDSSFDAISNQSLTLSPDLSGQFVGHTTAAGSIGIISPGTLVDRSPFAAPVPIPAAVWLFGSGLLGLIGYSRWSKAPV